MLETGKTAKLQLEKYCEKFRVIEKHFTKYLVLILEKALNIYAEMLLSIREWLFSSRAIHVTLIQDALDISFFVLDTT